MAQGDVHIRDDDTIALNGAGEVLLHDANDECPECCDAVPSECPCTGTAWDDLESGTTCPCQSLAREYDVTYTVEVRNASTQASVCSKQFTLRLVADGSACRWAKTDESFTHLVCSDDGCVIYTNPTFVMQLNTTDVQWEYRTTLAATCGAANHNNPAIKTTGDTPVGAYSDGAWGLIGDLTHEARITGVSVAEVAC